MMMVTLKISKKKLVAGLAILALAAAGGIFLRDTLHPMLSQTVAEITQTVSDKKSVNAPAETNEERLEFISRFGWEVEQEPTEILEVLIPQEFDQVYTDYNILQQKQGYDLSKYQGKRCKRYTYEVTNYSGEEGEVYLNLLVYKNKVIGGDVCSAQIDGFMHGFDPSTAQTFAPEEEDTAAAGAAGTDTLEQPALEESPASQG